MLYQWCSECKAYHAPYGPLDDDFIEQIMARIRAEFGAYDTTLSYEKPKEPTREEKLQAMARQDVSPNERDNARRMLKAKGLSW